MRIALLLSLAIALGACPAMAEASQLVKLKRLYQDLLLDQRLDRFKLDRLMQAALEDDLVIDPQEKALLDGYVAKGYDDPTGDPAPAIKATFEGEPIKGWVGRAQKLLVIALRANLASRRGGQALRELMALAWREDLSGPDRERILVLIDHYREVDTKQASRDAMEALALLMTNPEEARRDLMHRRQLELLSRLSNSPNILSVPGATAGLRP